MRPPRIPRLLLRWLLPPRDRDVVLADLDEDFARRAALDGRLRATSSYWREGIASIPYPLWSRAAAALVQVPGDVRFAMRQWRRSPAFAGAAILAQAIGIALATAVIAVAHGVLVRPLPYAEPEDLVQIFEGTEPPGLFSYQDFIDLRQSTRAFSRVAGFNGGSRTLTSPSLPPERINSVEVTDGFFDTLGVQPLRGRTFTGLDTKRGAPAVLILSHPFWTARLGADPDVIGRTLTLNGQPHTVIGVLPEEFGFPPRGSAELWLPLRTSPLQEERGYWHWMDVIGRRDQGVSDPQVSGDLASIAARFAARDAKWHASATLRAERLHDVIVSGVRPTIQALLAGVALVLIATCATIAGLLLSRSSARARELSVRAAIGAGRGRLVRQLLTETLALALVSGGVGVLGGYWLLRTFVAMMPERQRAALPHMEGLELDPSVIAVAILLSLATGALFGMIPAVRAAGSDRMGFLRSVRATPGRSDSRLRSVLVAGQVAVAFVLLSGAILLSTSVHRLLRLTPGFETEGLVTLRLTLSPAYRDTPAVLAFQNRLRERLEAIPGTMGVALINQAPLTGRGNTGTLAIVGRAAPSGDSGRDVGLRIVSENYFSVLGIPLVKGRPFAASDVEGAAGVVLVNELMARRVFPGLDPIGQRITFEFAPGPWEIVGVVGNERLDHLDRPLLPVVYFSARQDPMRGFTIVARTAQPTSFAGVARAAVAELDPELPLFAIRSIEEITATSEPVFVRRAAMWLVGVFALAAVVLAALSIYGVLAQAVSERTREIGVRVALGATRSRIFGAVLRSGLSAAAAGLALGIATSFAVSRLLSSLLFEVQPGDPLSIVSTALFLATVAVMACLIPARRAVRIDPASAVRSE